MSIEDLMKRNEKIKQKQKQKEQDQKEKEQEDLQEEQTPETDTEEENETIDEEELEFVKRRKGAHEGIREIVLIIDESYSMIDFEGVVEGYNTFLFSQQLINENTYVTTTTFNDKINIQILREKIGKTKPLKYDPDGRTALYDAIGTTIKRVRETHLKIGDDQQPDEVIFGIITDGEENASIKYSGKDIKQMIELLKKDKWRFVFLGATPEVCKQGEELGIDASSNFTYSTQGDVGKNIFGQLGQILALDYTQEKPSVINMKKDPGKTRW